ncbi:MAG: EFR1 family ferrodoxin [Coriobacteriales bacterium]|jgi:ferredoxin
MVFYFTATGNSLHVARSLDKSAVSIPQALKGSSLEFSDETIGVVSPIYGGQLPYMVRDFLSRAKLHCEYLYVVLTYGMSPNVSSEIVAELAREHGLDVQYFNTVRMVDNYLPAFDMAEQRRMDKGEEEQIASIRADVEARRRWWQRATPADREVYKTYQALVREHPDQSWESLSFHADDSCVGCGVCVSVCPGGCIRMKGSRPSFDSAGCQKCLACVQNCPRRAIRMSLPEPNRDARYRNPHVTLEDLIAANSQSGR